MIHQRKQGGVAGKHWELDRVEDRMDDGRRHPMPPSHVTKGDVLHRVWREDRLGIARRELDKMDFTERPMQSRFSLFVLPVEEVRGAQDRQVVLLSRTPAHKFFEKGPWRLRNVKNDQRYEVSYLLPTTIEMDGSSGTLEQDVLECLQSVLKFPVRIDPEIGFEDLPALLTPLDTSREVSVNRPHSCVCSFRSDLPEASPDTIVRTEEVVGIEESLSELKQELLRFRREVPEQDPMDETLTQRYADAVNAAFLKSGMVVPCEIEQGGGVTHVACLLIEELAGNRFRCDLYAERPIEVQEGVKLIRRIEGHEDRQELSCVVGTVLSCEDGP